MKFKFRYFFAVILVLSVPLIIGFFAGRLYQDARHGYHFEVRQEEKFKFGESELRWRYATDTVGPTFMDPGTTIIEYEGRTLYKARRGFQESFPFAQNIQISGNSIYWNDGEYAFHLAITARTQNRE